MSAQAATVEVLAAEVRVLMVGSRQVTLSVYRQLDEVHIATIEPFGRVRSGKPDKREWVRRLEVVGVDQDGQLCRSWLEWNAGTVPETTTAPFGAPEDIKRNLWHDWEELPLIVLAGLR
jgi:hypothetical protein